jgi:hypothetical protein
MRTDEVCCSSVLNANKFLVRTFNFEDVDYWLYMIYFIALAQFVEIRKNLCTFNNEKVSVCH